jgi:hypothetical protein
MRRPRELALVLAMIALDGGLVYLHPGLVPGNVGSLLDLASHERTGPVVPVWPPPGPVGG